MDPFLELIRLLRPQATLWSEVEASGRWGLSFRRHDDLLFCWLKQGACYLSRPGFEPLLLRTNDFVLVRTSTPFNLISGEGVVLTDSETVIREAGSPAIVGSGQAPPVKLRGGKFVFDTANEQLLTGLLPQVVHVQEGTSGSERLRTLLTLNESESNAPGPGSGFVIARLMELALVEILRSRAIEETSGQTGLLTGLNDAIASKALMALHSEVARRWTTKTLARACGVSRSALALRFARLVGMGPMEYLQQWRIAVAKDELRRGTMSIGDIAGSVGFQSVSSFSTAFRRAVGCPPRQFTNSQSAEKT